MKRRPPRRHKNSLTEADARIHFTLMILGPNKLHSSKSEKIYVSFTKKETNTLTANLGLSLAFNTRGILLMLERCEVSISLHGCSSAMLLHLSSCYSLIFFRTVLYMIKATVFRSKMFLSL